MSVNACSATRKSTHAGSQKHGACAGRAGRPTCRLARAACTAASPTLVSTPAGKYEKGAGGATSARMCVVLRMLSAACVSMP